MSNGNSKLPPNSGMSDERWLTPDERDAIGGWFQQRQPNRESFENADALLDHAEAADKLITELAERLRATANVTGVNRGCDCNPCWTDRDLLARVDALTKDTA